MPSATPTVRDFMTQNPATIDGALSVADAAARMFQVHARHLPVYVEGHLVGILSDRDIAHLAAVRGVDPEKYTAEQACTPNPYVVTPDAPLEQVVLVLSDHKFGAALVMEAGQLIGIFTVIDALQALAAVLRRDAVQAADPAHEWTTRSVPPTPEAG
ncbi:CBS domain-containing protein [Nannocystis sp.]|uniref:CBS domain-containing protein n=1 Tax=Nannocystis sp. TaxID=1962667 RepID=UPI002428E6D9|nr:CBS domain-containing protein [Nannocystis sp.]MBK7829049.1 CBS domain-containing protein [Nannocystis sp.]MBK9757556.1 CBS domain-containing protein [Nannocystis sp.]